MWTKVKAHWNDYFCTANCTLTSRRHQTNDPHHLCLVYPKNRPNRVCHKNPTRVMKRVNSVPCGHESIEEIPRVVRK